MVLQFSVNKKVVLTLYQGNQTHTFLGDFFSLETSSGRNFLQGNSTFESSFDKEKTFASQIFIHSPQTVKNIQSKTENQSV